MTMRVSRSEPGKVGLLRLWGAVILLIFHPTAFARWAAKHKFQTELLTNQQLREARPTGQMTNADWTDALSQSTATSRVVRAAFLSGMKTIALILASAWLVAFVLNRTIPQVLTSRVVYDARIASASILAWAVLGKAGSGIQTWGGRTLPEQVNNFWPRLLYVTGMWLTFLTLLLRPT